MYATTTAAVAALLLLGATSADDEEKIVKCGTTVISDGLKHVSTTRGNGRNHDIITTNNKNFGSKNQTG